MIFIALLIACALLWWLIATFEAGQIDFLLSLIVHHSVHISVVVVWLVSLFIGPFLLVSSIITWGLRAAGVF